MIHEQRGNLLEADVEAIVNTVNTVGVMGKGIALQFKQAFPDNYRAYRTACQLGDVAIGAMFVVDRQCLGPRRYIINFPTKRHWRSPSRLVDLEAGLAALVETIREHQISTIAVPALGCGNGGLNWAEVKPLIVAAFDRVPEVTVHLYPPAGAPAPTAMPVATPQPPMTRGRAAVIGLIRGYVTQASAERVEASAGASLLEIQKLMYLLQSLGEPLRLTYSKGPYGPYAENLNHQLQAMEGHYLRGYGDRTQRVLDFEPIVLTPEAAGQADAWMDQHAHSLGDSITRVIDLIDGFASPYGLELLATAHWVIEREQPPTGSTPASVVSAVQAWSRRKATIFTESHIRAAVARLDERGVLAARPSTS